MSASRSLPTLGSCRPLPASRVALLVILVAIALLGTGREAARAGGKLDEATLRKVKDATVYLRVTLPNGSISQGSGFFALEPGLVLTNAHVLGMLEADSRRPQRLDVTVRSGEADSRTLAAEVLGADVETDLALLRVAAKVLPAPLPLGTARGLLETQEVYIFGFPFGTGLGQNITVSKSSVSSLSKHPSGAIDKVQVNGGMHPGNSGGPVTNGAGQVVGVAAAVLGNTQIHFAIPADSVALFLNGRIKNFTATQLYRAGDQLKQPLKLLLVDPLGRVRKVAIAFWVGDRQSPKNPGPKTTFTLGYDGKGTAAGEIVVAPPAAPGQALWFEALLVDATGQEIRYPARQLPINPLERNAAVLAFKPRADQARLLRLDSHTNLKLRTQEGTEHALGVSLEGRLALKHNAPVPGGVRFGIRVEEVKLKVVVDGQAVQGAELRQAEEDLRKVSATLEVDGRGDVKQTQMDLGQVPVGSKRVVQDIANQLLDSLEALAVPLPGKEVAPLTSWRAQRRVLIGPPGLEVPALADLKYVYVGTRVSSGLPEALLELEGQLRKPPGAKLDVAGEVSGSIALELATGTVSSAQVTLRVDLDLMFRRQPARASGSLAVRLKRALP